MDAARWERLQSLFLAALERDEALRSAFLDAATDEPELRREVGAMLAAHGDSRASSLEQRLVQSDRPSPPAGALAGTRLGPYRLLSRIGRGGMGEVYLAERDDAQYRQRVAIKTLRAGLDRPDLVTRFRGERQILARLGHPDIARLLDGGVDAQGLPYLVMEHVEGVPITEHCDRQALSLEARLALFLVACRAVHYAHSNLVVHRDIKPSNLLVTGAGEVELLDFGIAKLLDPGLGPEAAATRTLLQLMTPQYASPEQVRGEPITTATDVYALGLLLYELLCGRRAQQIADSSPLGVARAVCEHEPPRPSVVALQNGAHHSPGKSRRETGDDGDRFDTSGAFDTAAAVDAAERALRRGEPSAERLSRRLRGDLDAIVGAALRKEPQLRYSSVEQLAADVERHLGGLPVTARRQGFGYRAGRFWRRHRVGVAATAAVAAGLVVGLAFAVQGLVRARRAESVARTEAEASRQVSEFLVDLFEVNAPSEARGNSVTARELLDQGANRIRDELAGQPEVQARLLGTMARAYDELGLFQPARELFEAQAEVQRASHGEASAQYARSLTSVADLLTDQGDYQAAKETALRALAAHQRAEPPDEAGLAATLSQLGIDEWYLGDLKSAREHLERALRIRERVLGPDHVELGGVLNNVAILYWQEGNLDAALPLFERGLRIFEKAHGPEHPAVAHNLVNLALVYHERGDRAQARPLLERALAIRKKILEPDHPDLAETYNNLGNLLRDIGELEASRSMLQEAVAIRERALGPDHPALASSLNNLGQTLVQLGDVAAAKPLLERALAILEQRLGADHPGVGFPLEQLALIAAREGDLVTAERGLARVVAIRSTLPPDHPARVGSVKAYGRVLREMGREEDAARVEAAVLARSEVRE